MEYQFLLAFTALVSLFVHSFQTHYWKACLVAAVVSTLIGLLAIFIKEHFPFAMIANLPFAIFNPGLPCFAVAAVVGLPFWLYRNKKGNMKSEPSFKK